MVLSAYKYEFSIAVTFYRIWYTEHRTTQCKFFLRNLQDDTQEKRIEQAKQILTQVVEELYYLTGFGIDKGVVKIGTKKVHEDIYPDLVPRLENSRFEALLFRFSLPYRYEWVKDNQKKRYITEAEMSEGWQAKAVPSSRGEAASFRLPVIVTRPQQKRDDGYKSFFLHGGFLTKKRKRTPYGFQVIYDRKDAIFMRFMARFYENGNLAFGEQGLFGSEKGYIEITGRDWPQSKAKPEKYPRRSILASQPKDNTEYVYFIQAGRTNIFKIGKSNNPQARLESLQTANPHKLKLLHIFKADNATAAEEAIHRLLHKKRRAGEWFQLTPAERDIILSVKMFEQRQFWIDDNGVEEDKLFG